MADVGRDELAELARLLGAHLEWQRDLGVSALPVGDGVLSSSAPVERSAAARGDRVASPPRGAAHPAPTGSVEGAPRFEVPGFLRGGRPEAPPPAPPRRLPTPVPAPPARLEPAPIAAPPAPPALTLFAAEPAPPSTDAPFDARPPEGEARLRALAVLQEEVRACQKCRLHAQRTQTVFARGNPFAKLMFVGEGPGREEDLQGAPFVGAAGQLLDKIIGAMGLREEEVYIANVVKCRPPNNRVPEPDEMASCGPYLNAQLANVRPEVVVALGKTAASYLLGTSASMSRLRGRWHSWRGIPLLATWHPAYLLRQPEAKRDTWEDMKLVLARLGRPVPRAGGRS